MNSLLLDTIEYHPELSPPIQKARCARINGSSNSTKICRVVCFDERPVQLVSQTRVSLPAEPGTPEHYDYKYKREGSCNQCLERRSPSITELRQGIEAWEQE